jgi:L-iditol 2-dehydrogenase
VAVVERPEPRAAAGQVVLGVRAAGVCGTDVHILLGEYPSVPPVTMGHEVCGVVEDLGEGVDPALLGARVVCETYYSTCGTCRLCRAGRINLCPRRRSIGSHVDGGFAPRLALPARNLHRVPEWLGDAAAALSEPLACVCQSLLDPPLISAGDDVLVIGPGPIGLLAAQVARSSGGAVTVRGTPRDGERLAVAEALGFATATTGEGAAVVVECSGSEAGMADALRLARRGGRIVQIGLRGADVRLPFDLVCFHELTISSGNASTPASWRRAMHLVEDRAVELEPLVSGVVGLDGWERAFDASRAGQGVKHVIEPR